MQHTEHQMRDAMKGTGFTCYRMKSNPEKILIVVPETYHDRASYLTKYSIKHKSALHPGMERKLLEDRIYLGNCLGFAHEEIKNENKSVRKEGERNFKFFRALLNGLEKPKKYVK